MLLTIRYHCSSNFNKSVIFNKRLVIAVNVLDSMSLHYVIYIGFIERSRFHPEFRSRMNKNLYLEIDVLLLFCRLTVWVNSIFGAASGSLPFLSGIRLISRGGKFSRNKWSAINIFQNSMENKSPQKLSLWSKLWTTKFTGYENLQKVPECFRFHVKWMHKIVITTAISTETTAMTSWHN